MRHGPRSSPRGYRSDRCDLAGRRCAGDARRREAGTASVDRRRSGRYRITRSPRRSPRSTDCRSRRFGSIADSARTEPASGRVGRAHARGTHQRHRSAAFAGRYAVADPTVLRTAVDARRAYRALLRGRRRLGRGLAHPDLGESLLDVS
jgi:hypothetical protein